jgi:hypothetical protein
MSDASSFLPLSQRKVGDESRVTNDWSHRVAETIGTLATLLESATDDQWNSPALRDGYSVRDTVGHLLRQLGTPRTSRAREVVAAITRTRVTPTAAALALSRSAAPGSRRDGVVALRALAERSTHSRHRMSIGDLTTAVVDGYDIALALGKPLPVHPIASGAVALARSVAAPSAVRAVLSKRRLTATDTDWAVGDGPALPGTAGAIILFLWQRRGLPQQGDPAAPFVGTAQERTAAGTGHGASPEPGTSSESGTSSEHSIPDDAD